MTSEEIKYFKGTHRIIPPSKTLENNEVKAKTAGITRITEITHLDRINIPVFSAIRPTSEDGSISVYGGKGITSEHAKASALMEGFERYSAERQNDDVLTGTVEDISNSYNIISPELLNLPKDFDLKNLGNISVEWSKTHDLITDKEYYIPSNAVFHPYILKNKNCQRLFKSNTNGLASGNSINEAILHGIFEVIERDAWSIFELTHKNSSQINLNTIKSEIINDTLLKFSENEINIKLMDLTADIKIPTIAASADDTLLKDAGLLTLGIGTHLDPEVAVLRALCEVAQSRATQIHGAREDTVRADFARTAGYERMKRINRYYFDEDENKISLSDIENKSTSSLTKDIDIVMDELKRNEIEHVLYYDLTRPELDVNVVRVIIPTMELFSIDPSRAGYRFLRV